MTAIEQIENDVALGLIMRIKKPMLLFLSDGQGVRSEFMAQFRISASENNDVHFAEGDPNDLPGAAACFQVGEQPLLLGIHRGLEISRSSRPWASDVKLALAAVRDAQKATDSDGISEIPTPTKNAPKAVTDDSFQSDVLEYETPVLVDFWAEWCAPCRMVAPILDRLAEEYAGHLRIAKVDVDANPQLSQQFRISSIPTMMAFLDGQILFNQAGALPEHTLRKICEQLIEQAEHRVTSPQTPSTS